ncbi:MAG: histidine ammonia-lyase [Rhodothermales bacterium]|nr:histidine ammonia-lyase [Rhodothermales bacterium]MBO6778419.1 histidine ammonia-lyase [Rhodothermales bacterium]
MIRIRTLADNLAASMAALRKDPAAVLESRARLEAAMATGGVYYGVNTGFGKLASKRIDNDKLRDLQRNILLSHAVGVGDPVPREIARIMLQLKIHALGLGYSGVSETTFRRLLDFERLDLIPYIPSRGSVGASGDLAPLAHLALPLLGEGAFLRDGLRAEPAAGVLAAHGLAPIDLQAKDGIALLNGTQLMAAYGAFVLQRAHELLRLADLIGTMSLEALQGSATPFDARIHEVRPHPGQQQVARNVRLLLENSEILESHRECGKVQDPYCLRCMPQVHGASRDAIEHATRVVETEMNSVTDNPLVFEQHDIISGGNFHGQPLALVLDYSAIALAELASISERRTYLLLEGHDGLPTLLMKETGLNSGFMIPQYTAAALVSENKVLCHPASVDSIPTSLGQEDHVSMGATSALKLLQVLHNVEHVMAIELIAAAQALDYRRPLRPGRGIEFAHTEIRKRIPHREADYYFQEDLEPAIELVRSHELADAVSAMLGD